MTRTRMLIVVAGAAGFSVASWACSDWFDSNLGPIPTPADASHPPDGPVDGTTPEAGDAGADTGETDAGADVEEPDAGKDAGKRDATTDAGEDAGDDAADGD